MSINRLLAIGTVLLGATFPAAAAELSLTEMIVKEKVTAGKLYDVALRYEGDANAVSEVCFVVGRRSVLLDGLQSGQESKAHSDESQD